MKDDISGNKTPSGTVSSTRNTQSTGNSGLTDPNNPYTYAGAQFFNLQTAGEPDPGRVNTYDNPSFLWPNNYYYNSSGNKVDIHRGYMRSLLTDPNVAPAYGGTGSAPNRRLFFQFNPQVLTRSVSQSVGAMNPLLQDPAQLSQPIPGTASFGFELFFNREQEVNNNNSEGRGGTDLPELPTVAGAIQPVAAELGVMADIMVLDSIIGQGISSDMVQTLKGFTDSQSKILEQQDKTAYENKTGVYSTEEGRKNYTPFNIDTSNLETQINANLGNSAFLNPLPVRVIFSSMFMVEGLVTSAEVTFQKFSANMVPTQCRVALNMYALYIGFAKKDTFLKKNLTDSATQQATENKANTITKKQLDAGISKINLKPHYNSVGKRFDLDVNFNRTDAFIKLLEDKNIKDVKAQISIQYYLTSTSSGAIDNKVFSENIVLLNDDDSNTSISLEKLTSGRNLVSSDFNSILKTASDDGKNYLTYNIIIQISGRGDYDVFEATPISTGISKYWHYTDNEYDAEINWLNPQASK